MIPQQEQQLCQRHRHPRVISPGDTGRVVQEMQVFSEAGLGLNLAWTSVSVVETVCLLRPQP